MGRIPAHRCSDIKGCLFNRYIADSKSFDKVDIDFIDDRFMPVSTFVFPLRP